MKQQVYVANCIEVGERFIVKFRTAETKRDKLLHMGYELASGWGAECTSVRKSKEEYNKEELKDIWNCDVSDEINLLKDVTN